MNMRIGIFISFVLTFLLLFPDQVSGQEARKRFEYKQVHMGVQARLVLYAPDASTARRAAVAAFDRIAELDQIMSDYRRDSELMQLCEKAGAGPVPVSDDLFHVLSASALLSQQSNGAFDVTIGPLVRLWREARRAKRLPEPDSLEEARSKVGRDLMKLDSEEQTVELAAPGMQLDLGGIAKGYAADEAVRKLKEHGIQSSLVEFGGDVVVSGAPPDSEGWRLKAPLADQGKDELLLENEALSTSGDTQQFIEVDGVRYSHVVDPRTGLGLTSRAAATVRAPEGMLSDALATALSILGPEKGRELINTYYPEIDATVRHLAPPNH